MSNFYGQGTLDRINEGLARYTQGRRYWVEGRKCKKCGFPLRSSKKKHEKHCDCCFRIIIKQQMDAYVDKTSGITKSRHEKALRAIRKGLKV